MCNREIENKTKKMIMSKIGPVPGDHRGHTDNEIRERKHIPSDGEAECTRDWLPGWLQQYTMGVYRLCRVLECVGREILPVFDRGLVFKKLRDGGRGEGGELLGGSGR
jgi:hypothetical protein